MHILDIVQRDPYPAPWAEGDNIPWHDPEFSARMLQEHLSQDHDAASRRAAIIEEHVAWLHRHILRGEPARVLDLGCGPGFYSSRLARLGHSCTGIDYSPYARAQAQAEGLACTYLESDIRRADYGAGYDLAMLIFGEFNVFKPEDAQLLLAKAYAALRPGGVLTLEPHTYAALEANKTSGKRWFTARSGLFAPEPHLALLEDFWDGVSNTLTRRYYTITAAVGIVTRWAQSFQAYTDEGYRAIVAEAGFNEVTFYPSLAGKPIRGQEDYFALTARKPES